MSQLSICIAEKLATLPSTPYKPYLFRINDALRRENSEAYEPEIVAIGPYHRGKVKLQMMEEHKLLYLQELLKRRNELSVDMYVIAMQELEQKARKCYAEPIKMNRDEFVEMMLLDGSFIIELFRKFSCEEQEQIDDPIFQASVIWLNIRRDLLLFENQLPFFVLSKLFDMSKDSNQGGPQENILVLALKFLLQAIPDISYFQMPETPEINDNHLLSLVHAIWCSRFATMVSSRIDANQERGWSFIKCTTGLRESGIKFVKATDSFSLFDIKFTNGIVKIPRLKIVDRTECLFRNMVAYEQYKGKTKPAYVTDYVIFIDRLINSPMDVKILDECGVIDNWLGNDKAVSFMVNKMSNQVGLNPNMFSYAEVFNDINEHCGRTWHTWMANLNHNYFNNPWSSISVIGAFVLLVLTGIQTICSILQI
ncbi:unnamed protein product [Ilex paraguariensis]|uniref:Uncharacterized protein n=1 Tax=Ilex paraguariensis TaxID=185542 RepID=A0ABC8RUY2_9AQUA